jgi:hypothetical protein
MAVGLTQYEVPSGGWFKRKLSLAVIILFNSDKTTLSVYSLFHLANIGNDLLSTSPLPEMEGMAILILETNLMIGGSSGYFGPHVIWRLYILPS